jgi:hypothetical protein
MNQEFKQGFICGATTMTFIGLIYPIYKTGSKYFRYLKNKNLNNLKTINV